MSTLTIRVVGIPAPQGSKSARAIYRGRGEQRTFTGKVAVHESSKKVKPWREDVTKAAYNAMAEIPDWKQFDEPVEVSMCFIFARPSYHFGTGRNRHILKPNAPDYVPVYPDLDKLIRSTCDAIGSKTGAGVVRNDSQIVRFIAPLEKRYVRHGEEPGALITVRPLTPLDSAAPVTSTPTGAADPTPAGALF
jgi:Holliday junction resolvase RusA-like endonuclease